MFIFAIIIGIIAVIAIITAIASEAARFLAIIVAFLGTIASILLFVFSSNYQQDIGQASVLRDWTGNIVGYQTEQGLHPKAPWVDVITFDVRNQRVVFVSEQEPGEGDNAGGQPDGPQITVQDAEGVTANIDIAIRYSIDPEAVVDIYSAYGNEENLRTRLILNDIRSVVRSVPGGYETLEMLTQRDDVQQAIFEALERKWDGDGLIVEDVALQEIRYGETVTQAFAAAQEAQIAVATEQAKLEAIQVSAQQKVVQAQAEADANAILNASLTTAILQQRYLDTLKELAAAGNLVIVPEGFSGLVNLAR